MTPQPKSSSWIQLGIFTAFLFLLVAIPYTLYIKSFTPKASIHITNLAPTSIPTPLPKISPPPPGASTSCTDVPDTYQFVSIPSTASATGGQAVQASPTGYLIHSKTNKVCFPASLPPFPFVWKSYSDYLHGYSLDIPTNWDGITDPSTNLHTYSQPRAGDTAQTSDAPAVSFGWTAGNDPYASDSSYFQYMIKSNNQQIKIYTSKDDLLIALFPMQKGYFYLQTIFADVRGHDSAFYAFQHMLDSLKFLK